MRNNAALNRIIDQFADAAPALADSTPRLPTAADDDALGATAPPRSFPKAKNVVASPENAEKTLRFAPRLAVETDDSKRARSRDAGKNDKIGKNSSNVASDAQFADASPAQSARLGTDPNESVGRLAPNAAHRGKETTAADSGRFPDADVGSDKKIAGPPKSLERRDEEAKRKRRRQIDPTTCERDYSADEIEFMKALDDYKRASGRMFPTCSEILEVFKSLGYVKTTLRETTDTPTPRNARAQRAATPAFLSDEECDAFEFNGARVPGVA